jgi:hypothetical protein
MTKYTVASRQSARPEAKQVAPIWRGIGCVMILVIPVLSYLISYWFVHYAADQGLPIPYQLMGNPVMPATLYQTGLAPVADFIASQQNLYAILLMTVVLIVVFGGVISVIYAMVYRVVGPPRYGPLDVEAPRGRVKRYKR